MTTIYKQPRSPKLEFTVPENMAEAKRDFRTGIGDDFFTPFPLKKGIAFNMGPFETFLHPDWDSTESKTELPCFTHKDHPGKVFACPKQKLVIGWRNHENLKFLIATQEELDKPKRAKLAKKLIVCLGYSQEVVGTTKQRIPNLNVVNLVDNRYYHKEVFDLYVEFDKVADLARKVWQKHVKEFKKQALEKKAEDQGLTLKEYIDGGYDEPAIKMSVARTHWAIENTAFVNEFKNSLDDLLEKMVTGKPYKRNDVIKLRRNMNTMSTKLYKAMNIGKVR